MEFLSDIAAAEGVREKIFGFREWRGEQHRVLQSLLSGKNVLTVMPTGMGKSLCYQIPAASDEAPDGILGPGFVLVVSPLIALM